MEGSREGGHRCSKKYKDMFAFDTTKPPREQEGGKVPVCDQM